MSILRWTVLLLLLSAAAGRPQEPLVAPTEPLSPQEQLKKFHLPPGFEIQLVAAEPDIVKPMNLAFDDRGRLYATQSHEYPYPAKAGAAPRDTVKILQDFGPDGRARKISTFADGLNIPIGVTPAGSQLLAYSIPRIYRFTDADGDGAAEKREPLYGDAGFNDTHGMLSSFSPWVDGWIYATHGFSNRSKLTGSDGHSLSMHSGNTFRFRSDGSRVEQYTHGQVNPFGLCFDPIGNLYSSDCHSLPAYHLLRDGWYPTFDGAHDGLGHAPSIMSHLHGSTGIAGIVWYASDHFPAPWRGTLLIGNPITHRINHDRLEPHGSSVKAIEQPDFLKCDDPWFRPVDLELAPDGTIYVADFYNRIIGHYEVPLDHPGRDKTRGRIWRIVYKGEGAALKPMPDLFTLGAPELIELLKSETLSVRVRATNQLVERIGAAAVEPLKKAMAEGSSWVRAHGLWVLERLGALDAERVGRLAKDPDRAVRVHLMKALAERATWAGETGSIVLERLGDEDPFVRRAAAEALSLHAHKDNLKPLLALWESAPKDDTHLIYMARLAIRNHLRAPEILAAAAASDDKALGKLANAALGAREAGSARFVLDWLRKSSPDAGTLATYLHHALRYVENEGLGAALEYARSLKGRSLKDQAAALRTVQKALQERGAKIPSEILEWAQGAVQGSLAGEDRGAAREGLALAKDLRLKASFDDVLAVAQGKKLADLRPAALETLAALDPGRAVRVLGDVIASEQEALDLRQKTAAALGTANSPEARAELLERLKTAPAKLAVAIATGLASSKEGSEALLAACSEGRASRHLLVDRGIVGKLRQSKPADLDKRLSKLTADLPPEDERMKKLFDSRRAGFSKARTDAVRGAEIFTKTCAGCHRIGGKGNKVGPELDGVGNRGLDRILEDVLDPNRNVDQAFRATRIKTKSGNVLSGLVLREEGQVLVIAEAADKETRVPAGDIEQRELSTLSPMPANVIDPLPEQDFYDLLAFLVGQRQAK